MSDLLDSCATTSFSTHIPHHYKATMMDPIETKAYDEGSAAYTNGTSKHLRTGGSTYDTLWRQGWDRAASRDPLYAGGAKHDYEVKSWPWFFSEMIAGKKKHDMRDKRDREYKVGDRMLLREFDPRTGKYTGQSATAYITYITDNVTPCAMSSSALDNNHAILSVSVTSHNEDFYA